MPKRLLRVHNVDGKRPPALVVDIGILDRQNAVYFHIVKRPIAYPSGRNRIVYIGATKKGIERIMSSIAERAREAFKLWGVTSVEVHEIGCRPVQKAKTWRKLERAALLTFRARYGSVPILNNQGKALEPSDEFAYFNPDQIEKFIRTWEP